MMRRPVLPAVLLCALLAAPAAQAGLFDDAEARQQIVDLKQQTEAKLDTQAKAQMELATQIMGLREELARLRGQIETLTYENEQTRKRQQDLYLDLDSRLRRFEPQPPADSSSPATSSPDAVQQGAPSSPAAAPAADPVAASRAYEQALKLFKDGRYKEAVTAFEAYVAEYPHSDMAASAQFWVGNSWYAQKDCKKAIDAQLLVTSRWPDSSRAPDAMLAIANCQRDWGNAGAARRTLGNLVERYPKSQAATQARQRLGSK